VVLDAGQRSGSLFAPIHWSDTTASDARIGELVTSATDPVSGQPELKATPAAIAPATFGFRGFALARERIALPRSAWWARRALADGMGWLFASNDTPDAWRTHAATLFGAGVELAEYVDALREVYRVAAFRDGRLVGCLFVGPADAAPHWDT